MLSSGVDQPLEEIFYFRIKNIEKDIFKQMKSAVSIFYKKLPPEVKQLKMSELIEAYVNIVYHNKINKKNN